MSSTNTDLHSDDLNWEIFGIKYEIFKRLTPEFRHDLISPLSVALMQLGVVKKKLKSELPDIESVIEHVNIVESQIKEGVKLIRAADDWDHLVDCELTVNSILKRGVKLFRNRLLSYGIDLQLESSEFNGIIVHDGSGFLYSWLTILSYIEDFIKQPTYVKIVQIEERKISLQMIEKNLSDNAMIIPKKRNYHFGTIELNNVANYYSTKIDFDQNYILFEW